MLPPALTQGLIGTLLLVAGASPATPASPERAPVAPPAVTAAAVAAAEAAVAERPEDAEAHFQLGLALCDHVDNVGLLDKLGVARRLREEFETAVELDPGHVGGRIALIEFHRQAPPIAGGDLSEVSRQAEELVAQRPREGRLALARMLRKYGETRAAERQVRVLLGVEPEDRDALMLLAQLADDVGRVDEAVAVLHALLSQHPRDEEARHLLDALNHRAPAPPAATTAVQALALDRPQPVGVPGPG